MTESTKNQFDAPWYVFSSLDDEITVIENESGRVLAELYDVKTANRLSHLPELYDALMVAAYEHCRVCLYGHAKDARHMPKPDDMTRNGCTLSEFPHCPNRNWWNLLKKVRDGE